MIIRHATREDENSWDTYAANHPEGSPYHLFAWKKAIEQAYNHASHYLLAEEESKVRGILPLIRLKLPFAVNELTALPFCDVGNILSDDEVTGSLLLREALEIRKNLKDPTLLLRGNITVPEKFREVIHAESTNKVRMFLELPSSSEELLQRFKSKLRSQIKKAEKNGLVFHWGDEASIDDYYSVFSRNMHDLGSPVHAKKLFSAILNHYGERAKLGLVSYHNTTVGCCILLTAGKKIAIPWASTLRSHNRLAPNMLLYWNALKFSADNGYTHFDFGRSSEGEGTFKFKKQWGAQPVALAWYTTRRPQSANDQSKSGTVSQTRQKVETLWTKLPLSLTTVIGPAIRKYISL